jgi:hypothetical protein
VQYCITGIVRNRSAIRYGYRSESTAGGLAPWLIWHTAVSVEVESLLKLCEEYNMTDANATSGGSSVALRVSPYWLSNRYKNYAILLGLFCLYMSVCTLFYTYYENWEASVAMFFVVETMTTVGEWYVAHV